MNAIVHLSREMEAPQASLTTVVGSFAKFVVIGTSSADSVFLSSTIEGTVKSLSQTKGVLDSVAEMAEQMAGKIRTDLVAEGDYLDPDLALEDNLTEARQQLSTRFSTLQKKKQYIDRDFRLGKSDCNRLHAAYEGAADAIRRLRAALESLSAAVRFHDEAAVPAEYREVKTFEEVARHLHGDAAQALIDTFDRLAKDDAFTVKATRATLAKFD